MAFASASFISLSGVCVAPVWESYLPSVRSLVGSQVLEATCPHSLGDPWEFWAHVQPRSERLARVDVLGAGKVNAVLETHNAMQTSVKQPWSGWDLSDQPSGAAAATDRSIIRPYI